MALVRFHMLEGQIDKIKEIHYEMDGYSVTETTWEDEHGNRSVIIKKDISSRKILKERPIIDGVIERKDMARKRVLGRITGNNNEKKMMPPIDQPVMIGTIFYASWGYDQTNINYFQVVGISSSGKSVRLRPIKSIRTPGPPLSMSGTAMPLKDQFDGPEKRYKYHPRKEHNGSSEPFVKIESYMYANLWDGKPKSYTSYA